MKLDGKVAIVTGGANGIGRAIAIGMARGGADVVVADLEMEPASGVVNEIKALCRKALAIKVDVAASQETNQMVQATLDEFGRIDILVNNAGGSGQEGKASLFHEKPKEVWDFVLGINLGGVFNCTRAVINHMIERKSGKIINIASTAGMVGLAGATDYSTAKAGIIGFTMALAKEVATHGINVNAISPGPIETRLLMRASAEIREAYERSTGFGRLGKPEDIGALAVFLASDDASFITGQNYFVGGLRNLGMP